MADTFASADRTLEPTIDVLLVADDDATRRAMAILLQRLGVLVRTDATVIDAMEGLTHLPAVVILDTTLAEGNVIDVFEMIRQTNFNCKVAVLVDANDLDIGRAAQCLRPDLVMQKPLDFEQFGRWFFDL